MNIHQLEANARGSRLRQVVLTDYIDDDVLETASEPAHRVAACPVFLAFARHSPDPTAIALLAFAALVGAVLALPNLIRYAVLSWRHLPVDGSVRQIAEALLEALTKTGAIGKDCRAASLVIREGAPGLFHVSLGRTTTRFPRRSVSSGSERTSSSTHGAAMVGPVT